MQHTLFAASRAFALAVAISAWTGDVRADGPVSDHGVLGAASSTQPAIAVSRGTPAGTNTLHAAWQDFRDGSWQVYYSRSIDQGQSWEPPLRLSGLMDGNATRPAIATDGGEIVYVVWHAFERSAGGGHQEFIRLVGNFDNGSSGVFYPIDLNLEEGTPATAYATAPWICAAPDEVHVTWIQEDSTSMTDEVFVWSMSTAVPLPFDKNLYRFDGAGFPKHPRVATDGTGNVYLAFLDDDGAGSGRDPYLSHAVAPWSGDTWSSPIEVPGDLGLGMSEPEKGNASELRLDAAGGGFVVVAWIENAQTFGYVNWSLTSGASWSTPVLFHDGADASSNLGDAYDFDMEFLPGGASNPSWIALSYGIVAESLGEIRIDQQTAFVDVGGTLVHEVIGVGIDGTQVLPRTDVFERAGELHVVWVGGAGEGPDAFEDIRYAHWIPSEPSGEPAHWEPTALVNDQPGVARSASPRVVAGTSMQAHVVFDDRRNFLPPISSGDGAPEVYHTAP